MSDFLYQNQSIRDLPLLDATPPKTLFAGTIFSLRSITSQRNLLMLLVSREIKARYKDSVLGVLWSLFKPIVQLLIFYIAIGKFLGAERSIPEFAIFVFAGLTAWGLFSEILSSSTRSIVDNAGLIKKVYLPREIFPLAAAGSAIFNFLIQFAVLVTATILLGQFPLSLDLLLLPFSVLLIVIFSFALGMMFAAINVYFRDMQHMVEVLLLVLFWSSPVVYSFKFVQDALGGSVWEILYLSNPITLGILGFQKSMWLAGNNEIWPSDLALRIAIATFFSLVLLWVSQRIFARLEGNFAQEI